MLTAHVRKYAYKGVTTFIGYVKCRIRGETLWTESTGVHSLTKADAKDMAQKLLDHYQQQIKSAD